MCINTDISICVRMCNYIHVLVYLSVDVFMDVCVDVNTLFPMCNAHEDMFMCPGAYMFVAVFMEVCVDVNTFLSMSNAHEDRFLWLSTYMYAYICGYIHVSSCIHLFRYICLCAC